MLTVQIQIPKKLKTKATALFKQYDLPLEDGIRLLIEYAVQSKKVPYHPHVPNDETVKALQECLEGKGTVVTLEDLRKQIMGE